MLRSSLALLVSLLLTITPLYASDDNAGAVLLEKGQPAPFSGFLITREKANTFRLTTLELDYANKNIEVLTYQNKLYSEQLSKSNELITNLNKTIVENRSTSKWEIIGAFVLGAVITSFIGYGVYSTVK